MVVGNDVTTVDLLVVGGGPGGYSVAKQCADQGMLVALVEEDALGGTCLNVGCIPSKALLHVAEIADHARTASVLGLDLTATVAMPRVRGWMPDVVARLQGGVAARLARAKVEVIHGKCRFQARQRALVTGNMGPRHIEFEQVVIASGSTPIALPALPVDGERIVDSSGALALTKLPEALAVVGAGYIGVEIGTAFAKLGSKVTILDAADRILPSIEESLTAPVSRRLHDLGVEVVLGASITGATEDGVAFTDKAGRSAVVRAEIVLSAVGRVPNTRGVGLDHLPVDLTPSGHIRVDAQRCAGHGVYAIGDVTEGPALAHKAVAEASVVASVLKGVKARFEPACIPLIVFSDPEIVSVGLNAREAAARGLDAGSVRRPLSASGRAHTLDRTDGFMELVYARDDRSVLGVHMVGAHVSELAGEAALAIEMAATVGDVGFTIHPHPTLAEELPELALAAMEKLGDAICVSPERQAK